MKKSGKKNQTKDDTLLNSPSFAKKPCGLPQGGMAFLASEGSTKMPRGLPRGASLDLLPKKHYNRVPLHIKEGYRQVVMKMRAMPVKKAEMTFDLTVKIWKPIVMALRADFEKQTQARELPHNMKFTDYFLQFQRAADRDFRKTHGGKKVAKHLHSRTGSSSRIQGQTSN